MGLVSYYIAVVRMLVKPSCLRQESRWTAIRGEMIGVVARTGDHVNLTMWPFMH